MPFTGDFKRLETLRRNARALVSGGFRRDLSIALGTTAMKLVADGFRKEQDPYGTPWEKLKLRDGRILQDTGRMRASVNAQPRGDGFRLSIPVKYAVTHQKGMTIRPKSARALRFANPRANFGTGGWIFAKKVTIPRRQMVPEASTGGLGPTWLAAFNRTANKLVRTRLMQGTAA